ATMLVKLYPDAALPAILAGVRAAKDSWTRGQLVDATAGIKGDGPVPFLLREAEEGEFAQSRFAAARCLSDRGLPAGLTSVIGEWNGRRPKSQPRREDEPGGTPGNVFPPNSVAEFLAASGKVEAIEALRKDLRRRPVGLRMEVVSALRTEK